LLDVDIVRGLEIKILYNPAEDPNTLVRCYFCNSKCHRFDLHLWNGVYLYQECTEGTLDLPEVRENTTWILKIYRRKPQLMIDLDGVNILEHDTAVGSCSEFWKTGQVSKMVINEVSQNVVTHYRIAAKQDGDKEDESEDDNDGEEEESQDDEEFTGKIYVFKLSVSKGGYKGGTDLAGKGDLALSR